MFSFIIYPVPIKSSFWQLISEYNNPKNLFIFFLQASNTTLDLIKSHTPTSVTDSNNNNNAVTSTNQSLSKRDIALARLEYYIRTIPSQQDTNPNTNNDNNNTNTNPIKLDFSQLLSQYGTYIILIE